LFDGKYAFKVIYETVLYISFKIEDKIFMFFYKNIGMDFIGL